MLSFKSVLAGIGLASFGFFSTVETAEAGTIGFADIGISGFLSGTYDAATGDVSGAGFVTVDYDFSLPLSPASYSGFVLGGASFEVADEFGAPVSSGDIPIMEMLAPEVIDLGTTVTSPEFAALVALLSGGLPATGPLDLGMIGFGSVTGSYSLSADPSSTGAVSPTAVAGTGAFTLEVIFADTLGGDLESIVSSLAPASGSLTIGLDAFVMLEAQAIPSPAGAVLLPVGLFGMVLLRRRQKKAA